MDIFGGLVSRSQTRRGIVDQIKYDGPPDVMAWKYPYEDIKWGAQLIVNESQQAILVKDGEYIEMFEAGRHTLSTANYPVLRNVFKLAFGGNTPFTTEIWFFNLMTAMELKFGTPTPIQIQEPRYNVIVPVRAYGQMGVRIADCQTFLREIVGTQKTSTSLDVLSAFRGMVITKLKTLIAETIVNDKVSLLDIATQLDNLSQRCREIVQPDFARFGLTVVNFHIGDISFPEDDPIVKRLRSTVMDRSEFEILGDQRYERKRSFDVLEEAAKSAGTAGTAMGAGLGLGLGAAMASQVAEVAGVLKPSTAKTPPAPI